MMAGYASRTVLVSPTQQPPFDPASFTLDASLDVEQIANDTAVVGELTERVRSIAFDDFHSVMTLPPDIWAGYVALATMPLQRNLASSTLPGRELSKERIERMLRYGYVLRCLDEALDGEPAAARGLGGRDPRLTPPGVSLAAPIMDRSGLSVGAMGIFGPPERLLTARQPRGEMLVYVRKAARAVSRELGAIPW